MTNLREAAQMALDAMLNFPDDISDDMFESIKALRAALAQPEQEPTAYLCENAVGHKYFRWKKPSSEYKPIALYTAHVSPQRIWQGLTDEEIMDACSAVWASHPVEVGQVVQDMLREKNSPQ